MMPLSAYARQLFLLLFCFLFCYAAPKDDATALLELKASADLDGTLNETWHSRLHHCRWRGVKECNRDGRVTKLVLENLQLKGSLRTESLAKLEQLRVLSLKQNRLRGPLPDFSALHDLKSLYLDHNEFTGAFPQSLLGLHRLKVISLADNSLFGQIPPGLAGLPRLRVLCLQNNRFTGSVPKLNQSGITVLNVSNNDLSGPVPGTPALSALNFSSFVGNRGLCGAVIGRDCSVPSPSEPPGGLISPRHGLGVARVAGIVAGIGFGITTFVIAGCAVFWRSAGKRKENEETKKRETQTAAETGGKGVASESCSSPELQNNGNLVFCGEGQRYGLEDLLRATAEIMGRGTLGSTYKAVMEGGTTVTVKRLNQKTCAQLSRGRFERQMEELGRLRHPNVVSLRAYFHTKEERLLVFDYFRNGSLFALIHGAKASAAGKPLHWTSCMKIAEDVSQGLDYIHSQRIVHGDLKSSNVLIGPDFEACVTDCALSDSYIDPDEDESSPSECPSRPYRAPECVSARKATRSGDVFAYGMLLLEILSGRMAAIIRNRPLAELASWVKSVRADEKDPAGEADSDSSGLEEGRGSVDMILAIAVRCLAQTVDERPAMKEIVRTLREWNKDFSPSSAAAVAVSHQSSSSDSLQSQSPARWSTAIHSFPRDHASDRSFTERD